MAEDAAVKDEVCTHTSWSEEAGCPDHNGDCPVFLVCEDCGAVGRQTGWDSVL